MRRIIVLLLLISVLLIAFSISVSAHSGGTDSNGGHYNHNTGEYHYHHGHSAHDHPNGVCPYDNEGSGLLDFLFVLLGIAPVCIAVIWGFEVFSKEEAFYTGLFGCISLGVFGISLTGTLRSFATSSANAPIIILCIVCLVTAIICGYVYNKRT